MANEPLSMNKTGQTAVFLNADLRIFLDGSYMSLKSAALRVMPLHPSVVLSWFQ
jgi:hypothetical protein